MMLKDSSSSNYLFIDTSFAPTWGLYNGSKWLHYEQSTDRKASDFLHIQLYEMLKRHSLEVHDVKIILSLGPGSYTGMRLIQGIKDIFELEGLSLFSFFHFEVPKLLGVQEGEWITKAFKGEVYSYTWSKDKEEKTRKPLDGHFDLTLFGQGIDDFIYESTSEMIYEEAHDLFDKISQRLDQSDIFYFRELNEEFPIKSKTK